MQPQPAILLGFKRFAAAVGIFLMFTACTAGRWILEPSPEIDRQLETVLDVQYRHTVEKWPEVDSPVLTVRLDEIKTAKYVQRFVKERVFQSYKVPKTTWAAAFLSAGFLTAIQRGWISATPAPHNALYSFAIVGILTGAGTHLQPTGTYIPTGERQRLNRSGTVVLTDTIPSRSSGEIPLRVEISHPAIGSITLNQTWNAGFYKLSLPAIAEWPAIHASAPGVLHVVIQTGANKDSLDVPLTDFMRGYVEIKRPKTAVYVKPVKLQSAALAELNPPAKLPLVKALDNGWMEVRYGITPCFVESASVTTVWSLTQYAAELAALSGELPFGRIDIERDVPVTYRKPTNAMAVAMSRPNKTVAGKKRYGLRDVKLMALYAGEFLGIEGPAITEAIDSTLTLAQEWHNKVKIPSDTIQALYVYINGALTFNEGGFQLWNRYKARFESVDSVLTIVSQVPARKKAVIFESDLEDVSMEAVSAWKNWAEHKLGGKERVIMVSASPGQASISYRDPRYNIDKMHGLFTYLFFNGLRLGYTEFSLLKRYLETDVLYFSRRFRDREQTPLFFGKITSFLPL